MDNSKDRLIRKLSDSDDSLTRQPMVFHNEGYEYAKKRVWARLSEQIRAQKHSFSFMQLFSFKNLSMASLALTVVVISGVFYLQKPEAGMSEQPLLFSYDKPWDNSQNKTTVNLTNQPFNAEKTFQLSYENSIKLSGKSVSELVGSKTASHFAFSMGKGDLTVDYTRKQNGDTLTVKAGHHLVSVIGTVFTTELKNNIFTLTVTEGKVSVKNGSKQIIVTAGNKYQAEDKPESSGKLSSITFKSKPARRTVSTRIPVREVNEKDIEKLLGNQP